MLLIVDQNFDYRIVENSHATTMKLLMIRYLFRRVDVGAIKTFVNYPSGAVVKFGSRKLGKFLNIWLILQSSKDTESSNLEETRENNDLINSWVAKYQDNYLESIQMIETVLIIGDLDKKRRLFTTTDYLVYIAVEGILQKMGIKVFEDKLFRLAEFQVPLLTQMWMKSNRKLLPYKFISTYRLQEMRKPITNFQVFTVLVKNLPKCITKKADIKFLIPFEKLCSNQVSFYSMIVENAPINFRGFRGAYSPCLAPEMSSNLEQLMQCLWYQLYSIGLPFTNSLILQLGYYEIVAVDPSFSSENQAKLVQITNALYSWLRNPHTTGKRFKKYGLSPLMLTFIKEFAPIQ
jgi:hypothetical protein